MRLMVTLAVMFSLAVACGSGSPTSPGGATALAFPVSPIAQSAIEFITPLGNLNPPDHLGVTRSGAYGIDLGVVNNDLSLGFINPARYASDSVHADAPLKYFVEPLKSSLYTLVQRTGTDRDGQVCFDQAGRLAGNWFLDSLPVAQSAIFTSGPMEMAFVRDVNDPSVVRISIGGMLAMTGIFGVAAGDPDPGSITPASGVVSYQLTGSGFGAPSGVLLVQMTAPDTIRVEAFPGAAPGAVSFTAGARTYVR
jgi:hypothetical protein